MNRRDLPTRKVDDPDPLRDAAKDKPVTYRTVRVDRPEPRLRTLDEAIRDPGLFESPVRTKRVEA